MEVAAIHQGGTAQVWRAGGMIWLIAITLFFASLDLYFASLSLFYILSIGLVLAAITAALFFWSLKTLTNAKKLPVVAIGDDINQGANVRKWFLIILIIEIVCLNIATFTLLGSGHFQYIVPVDILIVALHFIPLGRIFTLPVYYFHGIFIALIAILTMLFVPASARIGNLFALAAFPGLVFVAVNWIIVCYILKDGMKYIRNS
jgi:hypothetical protein